MSSPVPKRFNLGQVRVDVNILIQGAVYGGDRSVKVCAVIEAYIPGWACGKGDVRTRDCDHYVTMIIRDLARIDHCARGVVTELRPEFGLDSC
jgi:hypothetical protein